MAALSEQLLDVKFLEREAHRRDPDDQIRSVGHDDR
jgi:hypothetical protein